MKINILKNWIKSHKIKSFFLFIFIIFLFWQISLQPTNNKSWRDENKNIAEIKFMNNNLVQIKNVRDFYFDSENNFHKDWISDSFNPKNIQEVSFVISHFSKMEGVAHTLLTFLFDDGKSVSVSAEVRLTSQEKFSPIKGLFRQNEMYFLVGTERDIIGSRINQRNEEVFFYPLNLEKKDREKIFLLALNAVDKVSQKPEFYNTLWNNCTNKIVGIGEELLGQNIWWSWSHVLPGYADKKGFHKKYFKNPQNLNFEDFKNKHKISGKNILQSDVKFSEKIRENLK